MSFNADQFEQQVIDQSNATSFVPIPEGEYDAYIEGYKFREAKDSVLLDITWVIPDEQLAEKLNMEQVTARQSMFLDMTQDGNLDFGTNRNVRLGRLREALGVNGPGFQWAQLIGKAAKIAVSQRPDANDSTIIYNDVSVATGK